MLAPRLTNRNLIPHGGQFKIELPELGLVGTGTNFEMLLANVRKWRHANGFPNGIGLEDELETHLCRFYPQECSETDPRIPSTHSVKLATILQGTKLLVKHKLSGSPLVSQEVAESRAAICAPCPYNKTFPMECSTICGELKEIVLKLTSGRTTSQDVNLHGCLICHCFTAAAVHLPIEIQWSVLNESQKEQFRTAKQMVGCWKCL